MSSFISLFSPSQLAQSLLVLSLLFTVACGGGAPEDEEGCEHLAEGPALSVSATATAQGAPAIGEAHTRYDIALVDVAGGKGGSVSYAAGEAGDFILFLGADVPVKVVDANGGVVAFESEAKSSKACEEIKSRYVVELGVGTYTLELGPTDATTVSLVIESGGHEGE